MTPGERDVIGRTNSSVHRVHLHGVLGRLRRCERQTSADVQKLFGRGRRYADVVVGAGEVEMELGVVALHAQIEVPAANFGFREVAETIVVDGFERAISCPVPALVPSFGRNLLAAERTEPRIDVGAVEIEAILHVDNDRATEGVETEDRISDHNRDIVDRVRTAGSPS